MPQKLHVLRRLDPRLLATAVLALVVIAAVTLLVTTPPSPFDRAGCPSGGVISHTVIVLDRTDALSESKRRAIRVIINGIVDRLEPGTRLSLYEIDSRTMKGLSAPVFSQCRPRDGKHADALTENPRLLADKFNKTFNIPLQAIISGWGDGDGQDRSPLIECMMDLPRIKDFGDDVPIRQMVLFSDMLQHSNLLSHYASAPSFGAFTRDPVLRQWVPNLAGVDISLYYLLHERRDVLRRQDNNHITFWTDYFQAAGARLRLIEKVR